MPGAVLELAATAHQDVYLTGNPQITFFVAVYKRHTNFAIESIREPLVGNADFGSKVHCIVDRYGDLISNVFLEIDLPRISLPVNEEQGIYYSWTNSIGHAIVKYYDIEIGGQLIDRQYGQWLEIWNELTVSSEKRNAYNNMVGKNDNFNSTIQGGELNLRIPLQFWFCRNIGLALPLIALQFHEVKFIFEFRKFEDLWASSNGKYRENSFTTDCSKDLHMMDARLYIDYVFLDKEERRKFAQCKHEYLIDQLQIHTENLDANLSSENKIYLDFNHPTKEIVWVFQTEDIFRQRLHTGMELFNFNAGISNNYLLNDNIPGASSCICFINGNSSCISNCDTNGDNNNTIFDFNDPNFEIPDPMMEAKIQIEGQDRFRERPGRYFRMEQPYLRHKRVPDNFIYLYSFALNPEEHQPSGTLNFSALDNITLNFKMRKNITCAIMITIYAINYNVLTIKNGQAGILFHN